jgi:hypothetical protein
MTNPSGRFLWLANQFEALAERLNESLSTEERTKVLKRMKILINEIDQLIASTSNGHKQDATSTPAQPTADS